MGSGSKYDSTSICTMAVCLRPWCRYRARVVLVVRVVVVVVVVRRTAAATVFLAPPECFAGSRLKCALTLRVPFAGMAEVGRRERERERRRGGAVSC